MSPLARKLAASRGVPLSGIVGSGHHGRILRADVPSGAAAGDRRRPASAPAQPTELTALLTADTLAGAVEQGLDPVGRVQDALGRVPLGGHVAVYRAGGAAPESPAALRVGALRREPVLRAGRLEVGWKLQVHLTTDGQQIDPSAAADLLDALRHELEA